MGHAHGVKLYFKSWETSRKQVLYVVLVSSEDYRHDNPENNL